jgi:hypothetical protein
VTRFLTSSLLALYLAAAILPVGFCLSCTLGACADAPVASAALDDPAPAPGCCTHCAPPPQPTASLRAPVERCCSPVDVQPCCVQDQPATSDSTRTAHLDLPVPALDATAALALPVDEGQTWLAAPRLAAPRGPPALLESVRLIC